jgi:hypothetical protein
MKILVIAGTFYPATNPRSFRATELAKELAQHHEVTVLMPKVTQIQLQFAKEHGFNVENLGYLRFRPVRQTRIPYLSQLANAARRLGTLLFEYPSIELSWLVAKHLKRGVNYDLILSIAMPYTIHWGTAWSRSRMRQTSGVWVADCGDPYFGLKNDTYKKPFYFEYIEKWSFRKFDYISIPIEEARNHYFQEFHHKIKIIPQAFKFEDVPKPAAPPIPHNYPYFAYGGSVNMIVRNPRELIGHLLASGKPFKFVVYTSNGHIIQDLVDQSDGKVEIKPILPRLEFLKELHQYDFLVNIGYRSDGQRPSKLIDYAIIGKPILSLRTGSFNSDLVDEFMRGDYSNAYVVENVDQYRIENVVKQFLDLVPSKEVQ